MHFGPYATRELVSDDGVVERYLATHRVLNTPHVVEVLTPAAAHDETTTMLWLGAMRARALVAHRNVVAVHDVGRAKDGRWFAVLAAVGARTLSEHVRLRGRLPPLVALEIVAQLANAIEAVHARGATVGALSAERVVVSKRDGNALHPTLLDVRCGRIDVREDTRALAALALAIVDDAAGTWRAALGSLPAGAAAAVGDELDSPAMLALRLADATPADPARRTRPIDVLRSRAPELLARDEVAATLRARRTDEAIGGESRVGGGTSGRRGPSDEAIGSEPRVGGGESCVGGGTSGRRGPSDEAIGSEPRAGGGGGGTSVRRGPSSDYESVDVTYAEPVVPADTIDDVAPPDLDDDVPRARTATIDLAADAVDGADADDADDAHDDDDPDLVATARGKRNGRVEARANVVAVVDDADHDLVATARGTRNVRVGADANADAGADAKTRPTGRRAVPRTVPGDAPPRVEGWRTPAAARAASAPRGAAIPASVHGGNRAPAEPTPDARRTALAPMQRRGASGEPGAASLPEPQSAAPEPARGRSAAGSSRADSPVSASRHEDRRTAVDAARGRDASGATHDRHAGAPRIADPAAMPDAGARLHDVRERIAVAGRSTREPSTAMPVPRDARRRSTAGNVRDDRGERDASDAAGGRGESAAEHGEPSERRGRTERTVPNDRDAAGDVRAHESAAEHGEPSERRGRTERTVPNDRSDRAPAADGAGRPGRGTQTLPGARRAPTVVAGIPAPPKRYERGERIGSGGMAEVFRGTAHGAEGFARPVAIKRMLPMLSDLPDLAALFVREARIASHLLHPNVVAVHDFDRDEDGRHFLVMELVDGVSLDQLIASGPLPPAIARFIAVEVLRGLGHAHAAHIVHRDASPHNVLLGWDGAVKVADFGIATIRAHTPTTASRELRGKPGYLAPEQARGEPVDARADLFVVGIALWEMLTGERLVDGDLAESMGKLLFHPIPHPRTRRPAIPPALDAAAMQLLAFAPGDRPQTADAAVAALARCALPDRGGDPRSALAQLLATRFSRGSRRRRLSRTAPRAQLRRTTRPRLHLALAIVLACALVGVAIGVLAGSR